MKIFEVVNQVLEEMYNQIEGADEKEKDEAVIAAFERYKKDYLDLKKVNTADHSLVAHRFAYLYTHVATHADMVRHMISSHRELADLFDGDVDMASFGGGPGSDLLGALKFMENKAKEGYLTCFLYDRERGWNECWNDAGKKVDRSLRFGSAFEPFDILKPEDYAYLGKCFASDLVSMVFFVSEIYAKRDDARPFFETVFSRAKKGQYFLYIDNNDPKGDFVAFIDEFTIPNGFRLVSTESGWYNIETGEEKKMLGRFWNKFNERHSPKLGSGSLRRIYVKE